MPARETLHDPQERARALRDRDPQSAASDQPSSHATTLQLPQQPQLRHFPVALHRIARNLQRLSRLIEAQAAEEPHLDHPTLSRIDRCERRERLVESDEITARFDRTDE